MKFNVVQKLIFLLYACSFAYFTIIHVPFKIKYSNKVEYDTLFSNNSNLDVARVLIMIAAISVLAAVMVLFSRNLIRAENFRQLPRKTRGVATISFIGIAVLILAIILVRPSHRHSIADVPASEDTAAVVKPDTTAEVTDTSTLVGAFKKVQKANTCTEQNAIEQFESYMKFYYPDWKIYGKPVAREQSDCLYQVQFTTMNPHIRYEKEVMIAEISFNDDYTKYYFRIVRGTIY